MCAQPWAALFDWDGVVVDSSAAHERSWELLAAEIGQPLPPDHFKRGFGRTNKVIIPELYGWAHEPEAIERLSRRKEALYREIIQVEGLREIPGSRAFLEGLRAAGVPCVVRSSTPRTNLDVALEVLGLRPYFRDLVSADDVTRGKPDPEVFLKAAAKAGVAPEHGVVFEDATFGIQAAKAAGMWAVALTTTNPEAVLRAAGADRVVDRLDQLDPTCASWRS